MLYGLTALISFLILKLFSVASIPKLSDIPNERSMHSIPVKRSAGFIFFILFWGVLNYNFLESDVSINQFYTVFVSTIFFSMLGFIDDLHNLSSKLKLILELFFVFVLLNLFPQTARLFFLDFSSNLILNNIILTIYLVFISNLCNFMDGLDLYLSLTLLVFIFNFFIFNNQNNSSFLVTLLLLLSAMSGFFYYNLPNAKMFMGDSGSLPIGFLIGISPFYTNYLEFEGEISFIFLYIPIFLLDGIFTLTKRSLEKKHIFRAHREHLYQRVQIELKWGKWKTLIIFSGLNLIPSLTYLLWNDLPHRNLAIIFSLIVIIFIYLKIFLLLKKNDPHNFPN